jgi:sugar phosphate isomerase/epimerase
VSTTVAGHIFVSTACLPSGATLAQRLQEFQQLGFDKVELGGGVEVDANWLTVASDSDLTCLLHGYFPPPRESFVFNLASDDADVAQRSMDHVRAAVDASVALGAPFYSLHSGFITDPVGYDGATFVLPDPADGQTEAARERFSERLKVVLREAQSRGVGLLVENNVCQQQHRDKVLMHSPDEIVAFIEGFHEPGLGLLLDTGHLRVSAKTLGFEEVRAVERLRGFVMATHLHMNNGLQDQHLPADTEGPTWHALRPVLSGGPIVVEARFSCGADLRRYVDSLRVAVGAL